MFLLKSALALGVLAAVPAMAQDHNHADKAPPAAAAAPCPMMKQGGTPHGDAKMPAGSAPMTGMACMDAMKNMHGQAPATPAPGATPTPAAPHDHNHAEGPAQ